MAAVDDLILQIEDKALRNRLKSEIGRLTKGKKFGLVFEEYLPELTPIYSAQIQRGSIVARRDRMITDTWRVTSVIGSRACCVHQASREKQEFDVTELVVVRQFGEPIFPSLIPMDRIENSRVDAPWHTLIEADNYHALQLLEYLYTGQVDCIYIDPPYNTGARDWKYNNDYVDANDHYRHSKWLAMMRRLRLARRLLKPDTGVLIVSIDEHEVHHLGMLLEQELPDAYRQMVTIVINQKGVAQGRLSRVEEYAFFCFMQDAYVKGHPDDLLSPDRSESKRFTTPRWEWLLRGGTNSRREDRPGLFFPIFIDPERRSITHIGEPLPLDTSPDLEVLAGNRSVAWPLRKDGSLGNWRVSPPTLRGLVTQGYVKLGGYDKRRRTWTVLYLGEKARKAIATGAIRIVQRHADTGVVDVEYAAAQERHIKTVWHRSTHDAGQYGSSLLKSLFGEGTRFTFPKSLHAVRDTLATIVRDRPNALILDFFAGFGTTLHAVHLLNIADSGKRRCILVTNNEVADEEAKSLF